MTLKTTHLSAIAVLGVVAAALATTSGIATAGTASGSTCGVLASTQNGKLLIEGTVRSPVALSGSYQFSVQSAGGGGNSSINQGGNFTAPANQDTALGQVMINAGASYKTVFEIIANGEKLDCTENLATLR